jgi:hypothetical protein
MSRRRIYCSCSTRLWEKATKGEMVVCFMVEWTVGGSSGDEWPETAVLCKAYRQTRRKGRRLVVLGRCGKSGNEILMEKATVAAWIPRCDYDITITSVACRRSVVLFDVDAPPSHNKNLPLHPPRIVQRLREPLTRFRQASASFIFTNCRA